MNAMWQAHLGEHRDGLYVIGTIDVPMFAIKLEQGWALVEGGVEPLAPLVLRQLVELVGDLSHIRYWFITHSHYDHIGTLELLYAWLPNVEVFASEKTKRTLQNPKAHAVTRKLTSSLYRIMPEAEEADETLQARKTPLELIPITALADGECVNLGPDHDMQAIATPGHAKCLLSFYEPQKQRLYVSDTLGEMVSPTQWEPLIFQDPEAYKQSLDTLAQLPVACLALGHHGVLYDALANDASSRARQGVEHFITRANAMLESHQHDPIATAQAISDLTRSSTDKFISKKLHFNGTLLMLQLLGLVEQPAVA